MVEQRPSTQQPAGRDTAQMLDLVGFRVEHWRFAVRLEQVRTSLAPAPVTKVFRMPPFVLGIMSFHGAIVAVLDLARLLGLASSGTKPSRMLILRHDGAEAAVVAHDVFRVPQVDAVKVQPLPPHLPPDHKAVLEGVINLADIGVDTSGVGQDTLTLLDTERLFDMPKLAQLRRGVR